MEFINSNSRDHDHWNWIANAKKFISYKNRSCLDIGCGSGLLSAELKVSGATRSVGIDIIHPKSATADSNWDFYKVDLNQTNWHKSFVRESETFDLITCFDIIEHVKSPVDFLESIKAILNPNGSLVLTTPNIFSWERIVRGENWSGATDPQHKILFSNYSLKFLLQRVGFEVLWTQAPIRKLKKLKIPHPPIGSQLFMIAKPIQNINQSNLNS